MEIKQNTWTYQENFQFIDVLNKTDSACLIIPMFSIDLCTENGKDYFNMEIVH